MMTSTSRQAYVFFALIFGAISTFFPTCSYVRAQKYSFMKPAALAPQVSYYDYIVVGGGTSGCSLAATLSESANVLLLERGGAPYGRYSERPRAHGVIFRDSNGLKHTAYLNPGEKNEIIISAGAIGSPQLLMLSGIGPEAHLRELGINVLVDQPLVGQGMSDNPMNAVMIPSPNPVEVSLIQAVGITDFGSYIEAASSVNFANSIIHSVSTAYTTSRPSSINNDNQKTKYNQFLNSLEDETLYAALILEKVMGPISSGYLKLKTRNPNDNPSVTFNYFKEKDDLLRCVRGMETIIKIFESKSFSKFRYQEDSIQELLTLMVNLPLNRRPRSDNDTEFTNLEKFCQDTVMTIWHYHGGCQVGKVVDKDYKVFNVSGLRVIDGSTLYDSPGTNPQATVMMLGRYMGRMILETRSAKSL